MSIINTLLLTKDLEYSSRVTSFLGARYPDIKITALDSVENIAKVLQGASISVALIGEEFGQIDLSEFSGIACGFLAGKRSVCSPEKKLFCKYSSGEELFRIILGLYSEVSASASVGNENCRIYSFVSANGGAGSTVISAAFAQNSARMGHKVLYLCLDKFAPAITCFGESKPGCMSDLIFSVISSARSEVNLAAKAASLIRTDASGVDYLEGCLNVNDFEEMNSEMLAKMVDACMAAADYTCVVIDGSFDSGAVSDFILSRTQKLTLVSEGNPNAYAKLQRCLSWLRIQDVRRNDNLTERTNIVVNKGRVNVQDGKIDGVAFAGSVPMYKDVDLRSIAAAASRLELCDGIRSK